MAETGEVKMVGEEDTVIFKLITRGLVIRCQQIKSGDKYFAVSRRIV